MGLLFIFLTVILIIILIARIASKTRPDSEKIQSETKTGMYTVKKIESPSLAEEQINLLEALIAVLIRKGFISEEEMTSEIQSILEKRKGDDAGYKS